MKPAQAWEATIVTVERNGTWPIPWRWSVWVSPGLEVEPLETLDYPFCTGRTFTEDQAWRKAMRAKATIQERP